MVIDVVTSKEGGQSVTAYHQSGKGQARMWVINGSEYNTTYSGPLAHAGECLQALAQWLAKSVAQ
jgi:hypothetical protein